MNRAKHYWEQRILEWENARYDGTLWFRPASWSVRARLNSAVAAIRQRCAQNCRLLELGCGSGLLASRLSPHLSRYHGIDIANRAVERAKQRGLPPGFTFECADVTQVSLPNADLTVFLGLTDWLTDEQLAAVFTCIQSPEILFSYTEVSKFNPYRLYRRIKDGPESPQAYRARTFSGRRLVDFVAQFGFQSEIIATPYLLNPGGLVWATKRVD